MNKYKRGWFKESYRHSLAAKGIKTVSNGYRGGGKTASRNVRRGVTGDIPGAYVELFIPAGPIIGFSKRKPLDVADNVYPEWEGPLYEGLPRKEDIHYQQIAYNPVTVSTPQVSYNPVTVQLPEQTHPSIRQRTQQFIQSRSPEAGWIGRGLHKEAEVAKGVAHVAGKTAKGFLSTVAEGLVWAGDIPDDEPEIPPGVMGMGHRRDGLHWSKATLDEPDHPAGMRYPKNFAKIPFEVRTKKQILKRINFLPNHLLITDLKDPDFSHEYKNLIREELMKRKKMEERRLMLEKKIEKINKKISF